MAERLLTLSQSGEISPNLVTLLEITNLLFWQPLPLYQNFAYVYLIKCYPDLDFVGLYNLDENLEKKNIYNSFCIYKNSTPTFSLYQTFISSECV